jgi:hypothetical protein
MKNYQQKNNGGSVSEWFRRMADFFHHVGELVGHHVRA